MEQSTTKKKLQNHQDNFIIKNSTMMDLIVEKSHKIGENNQLMEQKTTSRLHVANFEKKKFHFNAQTGVVLTFKFAQFTIYKTIITINTTSNTMREHNIHMGTRTQFSLRFQRIQMKTLYFCMFFVLFSSVEQRLCFFSCSAEKKDSKSYLDLGHFVSIESIPLYIFTVCI